ncbi:hypothetical protein [Streptomyces sp. NPDC002685]|uniref:hypothetical protein n=1 Tax=Streptomyces sp. NPDC002685 TaxID=3154540 RepID=UPI00331B459F
MAGQTGCHLLLDRLLHLQVGESLRAGAAEWAPAGLSSLLGGVGPLQHRLQDQAAGVLGVHRLL